ncbi:Molybdopterin adenylyltransferase [Neisseria mucosa]|nr:Molybdopterin adenylyltransferase [Neisseria mucosa]
MYADEGIPALKSWLDKAVLNPIRYVEALIPDDQDEIKSVLIHMADEEHCDVIFTTGGTGPAPRDITPEATQAVLDKELPVLANKCAVSAYIMYPQPYCHAKQQVFVAIA